MSRREALSRMVIACALAAVGVPLVGPWLARWAAAQERKRLIIAQIRYQAMQALVALQNRLALHYYGDSYLTGVFRPGEPVALVRGGQHVAFGHVGAIPTTIVWDR